MEPQSSTAASGPQGNVPQDPAKNEPPQNVAAVTVETQDQNATKPVRTARGAKPGLMTNPFVGACLLIAVDPTNAPQLDPMGFGDSVVEFRLQAGRQVLDTV